MTSYAFLNIEGDVCISGTHSLIQSLPRLNIFITDIDHYCIDMDVP